MVGSFFLFHKEWKSCDFAASEYCCWGSYWRASAPAVRRQERFGGLEGVVKDSSVAPVPGATVTATNKTTGRYARSSPAPTAPTDSSISIPGRYRSWSSSRGFQKAEDTNVLILLGRNVEFSPKLQVGAVTEVVNVTGTTPQIDPKSTTVAHNVTAEEFDRLPKARSFQKLALTAPSVNTGDIEGGFQVNGASGAENSSPSMASSRTA